MKNYLKFATLLICVSVLLVTMNYCSKTNPETISNANTSDYKELLNKSIAMEEHILAFTKKMEYYRNNPGIKSSEKQYVLETVIDWESTLNLTYCDSYEPVINVSSLDTIFPLPVIEGDSMTMANVSERYYNAILAAVQKHFYIDALFTNQKLLAVDLELVDTYDSVKVSTFIGNAQSMSFPEYDWLYGDLEGTCEDNFYYGDSDAAIQSANYVRAVFYEEPPNGKKWGFTHIDTYYAEPQAMVGGVYIYLNPEDNDGINNNYDYLIYFADDNVASGLTDDVKCLESSTELNFYKLSYVDLTQGWINASAGKKFMLCECNGKDYGTVLQHELTTKIGDRLITNTSIGLPEIN